MKISEFISESAIEILKWKAQNLEEDMIFRGKPDENGVVCEVQSVVMGELDSVATVLGKMKKNEVIIRIYPTNLVPSDVDVKIAQVYGEAGGAFYIVNVDVSEINVVVSLKKFEKINIDSFFDKKGVIEKNVANFELRHEQFEMAKCIEKSMNENRKLIVEAGTGTGKTIAYLLPTLMFAIENNLKVIVSTNTINLQEQLLNKDIPLIKKILGADFTYQIVKGRGNYLCKRKLYNIDISEIENESEEIKNEKKIIRDLIEWDKNIAKNGDKGELKYEVSSKIWEKVNSEADMCKGAKCPYHSKCYFFAARKNISNATLLIVNHHMFFADLAIRNQSGFYTNYSILPNYDIVVFDEAHNIEDTARNYFTIETSKISFGRLIGQIFNRKSTGVNNAGVIPKLSAYLNENLDFNEYEKIDELKEDVISELNKFYDKGMEIFNALTEFFLQGKDKNDVKAKIDRKSLISDKNFKKIVKMNVSFREKNGNLSLKINKFLNAVNKYKLEDNEGYIFEFTRYFERLKQFFKKFEFIFEGEEEGYVYWTEITTKRSNIKLYATPFDISKELNENLISKLDRMIFTSATLAVDNKFDYYKKNIGLNGLNNEKDKKINERIIKSPFDYEKQMKVFIPEDALDPSNLEFMRDLHDFIVKSVKATRGHCFLLFTSYSALNYLFNSLKNYFPKEDYTLIKQNDHPRHEMIRLFKTSKNPVLFGTDSFWEGVDVQGNQLKMVMITKLPFKVPSDPVTEAIIENIKKNGQNAFIEYQVPQAVIKFKQGIGRLIRSKTDTGNIIILDNRVIKKRYGSYFLKTLPKNIVIDKRKELIKIIK